MTWDYAEVNPLSGSTGNFGGAIAWIREVLQVSPAATKARAIAAEASHATRQHMRGFVCTDPPYYDNIGYSDLSDFFYVWLRRSLGGVYPDLFETLLTPKAEELVATPYRFEGGKNEAKAFFEAGMRSAFEVLCRAQVDDIPLTLFYAFKQAESNGGEGTASTGWETMLTALLKSGLSICGTWPMRSELANRSIAHGTNALASSIVLVCRPRATTSQRTTRSGFLHALKDEMPTAIRTLQRESIAPVDLAQAAIGPGMAVFSRFREVLEADGSPMTVRTALALINQVLDEILAEQEGDYDPATRWALAWFSQVRFKEESYGTAETLATAKNTSIQGLADAGILMGSGDRLSIDSLGDHAPSGPRAGRRGRGRGVRTGADGGSAGGCGARSGVSPLPDLRAQGMGAGSIRVQRVGGRVAGDPAACIAAHRSETRATEFGIGIGGVRYGRIENVWGGFWSF